MKQFLDKNPKSSWAGVVLLVLSSLGGGAYNAVENDSNTDKMEQMYVDFNELQTLLFATKVIEFRTDVNLSFTGEAPKWATNKDSCSFNWAITKLESNECNYSASASWDKKDGEFDNYPRVVVDSEDGFWYVVPAKDEPRKLYIGPVKDRKLVDWEVFECKAKEEETT
jgi:hypothetical protein